MSISNDRIDTKPAPAGTALLYVNNLAWSVLPDQLSEHFSNSGIKVLEHSIAVRQRNEGPARSRGFGFVRVNDSDVNAALALQQTELSGRQINVFVSDPSAKKEPRPRAQKKQNQDQDQDQNQDQNQDQQTEGEPQDNRRRRNRNRNRNRKRNRKQSDSGADSGAEAAGSQAPDASEETSAPPQRRRQNRKRQPNADDNQQSEQQQQQQQPKQPRKPRQKQAKQPQPEQQQQQQQDQQQPNENGEGQRKKRQRNRNRNKNKGSEQQPEQTQTQERTRIERPKRPLLTEELKEYGLFSEVPLIDIGVNVNSLGARNSAMAIRRGQNAGVKRVIILGTSIKTSRAGLRFARRFHDVIFSTSGIHPHNANTANDKVMEDLEKLAENGEVVAIGECGLDYHRDLAPRDVQASVFEKHVQLAIKTKLPLIIHEREAFEDLVAILNKYQTQLPPVVIHCFTGTKEQLESYVAMGFYVGLTGFIAKKEIGQNLRSFVKGSLPLNRLMLETDAPYMTPDNDEACKKFFIGRTQSCILPVIQRTIAEVYGVSDDEIARSTTANAEKFFNFADRGALAKQQADARPPVETSVDVDSVSAGVEKLGL